MEAQLKVMRDAEERQEAIKALLSFQADQKRKDADLRRSKQEQKAARYAPFRQAGQSRICRLYISRWPTSAARQRL